MEISSVLHHYLGSMPYEPQEVLKPLKAPDCEQDVQRFEAILAGEGPYQPKSIDLAMPAIESNAVQNMGQTLLDKVSTMKSSVDTHLDNVHAMFQDANALDITDVLKLQWELSMFSIESSLITKSGDKAGEGIKTLFRNQ